MALSLDRHLKNVIVLGRPGLGKTHLAIGLAIAAAQSRRKVLTHPPPPTCLVPAGAAVATNPADVLRTE